MFLSRLLSRFGGKRTIAVDFLHLLPKGQNGGVKPAVFAFLDRMGRQAGRRVSFIYIANEATRADVEKLARPGDRIWYTHRTTADPEPGLGPDTVDTNRLVEAGVDLVYNPLGPDRLSGERIPFVCLLIDLLHRELPEALPAVEVERRERFFADACGRAAAIQVISDDVAERLVRAFGVDRKKLFRTYLPIQQAEESVDAGGNAPACDGSYFIYPANTWPHKNHARLLQAFRLFLDRRAERWSTWKLVLTGAAVSSPDELDGQIEQAGLIGRVIRTGYLERRELLDTISGAAALVYPSLNEGFGIPILEAQQAGIPIACSNVTCLPEVAGEGALFFDPRQVNAIADALEKLADDREACMALVEAGKANLVRFDFNREARRFSTALFRIDR